MFSISKYNEITSCIRGNELLTSILDQHDVSKLWLNAEHIFVTTKSNSSLYAFDVVPQLRWRRSVQTTPNDCLLDKSPDPVIEVIWDKTNPSFVYVISETGTTNFWQFLQPSNEWIKHKTIQLSNAKGSQIIDVKLHEESGNLVWCERRGFAADAYCVCYRSVNVRKINEKVHVDIGATQAILHNCPKVQLSTFSNGICIHPYQVYLEKIFMFWTSGRNIQAVVIKNGKVQESVTNLSDFRDIATALVGSWSENPDDDSLMWLGITVHPSTRDLLLLHNTGAFLKLAITSNIVKLTPVCNLCLPLNIKNKSDQIKVFTNRVHFSLIDSKSVVYIYDIVSGKLLQTFDEFCKVSQVQVAGLNSKQPVTVFWTASGIWKLGSVPLAELIKTVTFKENGEITKQTERVNGEITKEQSFGEVSECNLEVKEHLCKVEPEGLEILDVANWLCMFGLKHSATVMLLEHVISCFNKGHNVPENLMQLLRKLGKDVLQNPGILLTLFENNLAYKEESRGELKEFLDEIDQATVPSEFMTPLNMQVLPFLRELLERWSEELIIPKLDFSKLTKVLEESVAGVVESAIGSVAAGMPDVVCLEKMEILCLQEPEYAVKAFVQDADGEGFLLESKDDERSMCAVLRAELVNRRWKRRRSPDNATVIGIMFQLLYKKQPQMLLKVLDIAEKIVAEGASKDESTLQDLQECVRDFMLDYLPNIWSEKECDLKRINIHAQILIRLLLHRDALEIFLQRELWEEALELYVGITRSSTNSLEVSQLYEILLAGLLRGSGTSQSELLIKVFELRPEMVKCDSVFELCFRNTPESSMEEVFDAHSLTVGEAKKALETFLPKT